MKHLFSILLLFVSPALTAGSLIITKHYGAPPVAAYLVVEADYVAIPITISSDHDEPKRKIELIQTLRDLVDSSISKNGMRLEPGLVSLSPRDDSSFFSKSYSPDSNVQLYVLGEISNGESVFTQTVAVYEALKNLEKPRDTSIRFGTTSLGINDPEQHRQRILQLIKNRVEGDELSLGVSGAIEITGLENPVLVTQKNETLVGLYIDYGIRITY